MGKVSYTNLKLKTDTSVKEIEYEGNKIEVLKYLPIEDKYDLIMVTLQKSKEDNIYNQLKLDMYFHLHLVYMYTNISFTDKQRENETKLYDTLKSNGIIDKVIAAIEEDEYRDLLAFIDEQVRAEMQYKTTAASVLNKLVDDLPANAEAAMKIVENFDPDQYTAVRDFAKAANGGRDI